MGAHAPRTWAAHWSAPTGVAPAAGEAEYGVAPNGRGGWDLLWVDNDKQQLMFTVSGSGPRLESLVVDRGDIMHPALLRGETADIGAWIHQRNGGSDLYAALLSATASPRVVRVLSGPQPMEHPYLFPGPGATIDLVFSWQRFGNFDLFLTSLRPGSLRPVFVRRLTRARYYSFYPRATVDGRGHISMLHLEACCSQQGWNVVYDRFSADGQPLGQSRILYRLPGIGQTNNAPSQWGEDLQTGRDGRVWGAFSADQGARVFETRPNGDIDRAPVLVDQGTSPAALSLLLTRTGGYLFWEESFDLGRYLNSQRFDRALRLLGQPERVVYEGASQTNPHAFLEGGRPVVLWQATSRSVRSQFEMARFRPAVQPTWAQRLGLGLGDPWGQLAILVVSSFGVAVLTTVINILVVFTLAVVLLVAARVLHRVPGRWAICALLVTGALYLTFVSPGGPTFFLSTIPAMGIAAEPFGLLACAGALTFVLWLGAVVMRRMEDLYRAGLMAAFGVYFFAFVEAVVFIQQRIGYI